MKGATILAKEMTFRNDFLEHVKQLGLPYTGDIGGFTVNPHLDSYFTFDGHRHKRGFYYYGDEEEGFFEKHGYPEPTSKDGYRYEYSVECRSETFFCEVLSSIPDSFDILIYDTDGQLMRPSELDPETLVL